MYVVSTTTENIATFNGLDEVSKVENVVDAGKYYVQATVAETTVTRSASNVFFIWFLSCVS